MMLNRKKIKQCIWRLGYLVPTIFASCTSYCIRAQTNTFVVLDGGDTIYFDKSQLFEHEDKLFDGIHVFVDSATLKKVEVEQVGGRAFGYQAIYSNEKLIKYGHFYDGQKVGQWCTFNEKGRLKSVESYDLEGRKDGIFLQFDDEGRINKTLRFRHGEMIE